VRTRDIGIAVVALGGGRTRTEDDVDPSVGFSDLAGFGAPAGPEAPLGIVHARSEAAADAAARALRAAYDLSDEAVATRPVVLSRLAAGPGDAA
jgi:thymidine phosphorylase